MKFSLGQKVVLRRNNGPQGRYYYGKHIRNIPLGTKAIINQIHGQDQIYVLFEKKYGNIRSMAVHPDEIGAFQEPAKPEKQSRKINSQLEEMLLEDLPNTEIKNRTRTKKKPFKPAFNPLEEFAVWVREEFPRLEQYVRREQDYAALHKRKDEVMEGARMAYEHAMEASRGCVQSRFRYIFESLKREDYEGYFPAQLYQMVTFIEEVSANLGKELYYGTTMDKKYFKERNRIT